MELRKAVPKVARFCQRKQGDLARMMRLVPKDGETPARLWAFDGKVGCCVFLDKDQELPEALVDATWFTQAVRGAKVKVEVWLTGPDGIVASVDGSEISGEAKSVKGYPDPPIELPMKSAAGMEEVALLEAFSADFDPYAVLCFRKGRVEATDTTVAARVEIDGLPEGLVPNRVFRQWPAGKVLSGHSEGAIHFRVGDELRVAYYQRASFPSLDKIMPIGSSQPWCSVERKSLLTAFEKALVASDHGSLQLDWSAESGHVGALGANGTVVSSFAFPVWESNLHHGGHGCWVGAKPMIAAFKMFKSLRVLLRMGQESSLRLESGPYTVCVWPIRPSEV